MRSTAAEARDAARRVANPANVHGQRTDQKKELLHLGGGHARIYGPDGRSLAAPLDPTEEGILYADIDYAHILAAKNAYDPTGHYSRPDVLRLLFNPAPTPRVVRTERLDAAAVEFAEPIDAE